VKSDPALGATRANNAGVTPKMSATKKKAMPKKLQNNTRNEAFKTPNVGQFSGPRPSYVPYTVSEQAQDILNRSIRSYNK
jgi:hypothetical protein